MLLSGLRRSWRRPAVSWAWWPLMVQAGTRLSASVGPVRSAGRGVPSVVSAQQAIDEEYTRLIQEHLQDERITTELVDHLPASETVPTPLDFHGRIIGTPGELTYAADIHRYMRAIADASPRATVMSMGVTEEGREMVLMAIADEATIANLEQ